MRFNVSVPASSANLGPGFDTLGIALDLWTTLEVEEAPGELPHCIDGPDLFGGPDMVLLGIGEVAAELGRPAPGCQVSVHSEIPVARGLGSSATALVAGLVAGNRLFDDALSLHDLLKIAARIEGHGDNVSASLFGGVTLSMFTDQGVLYRPVPIAGALTTVAFVSDEIGMTEEARGVLPGSIPRGDAIANIGRTGLLILALGTGEFELLREAMDDRLHQPYRLSLFPHVPVIMDAATNAGAFGACLSGAGPSVLALCAPDRADDVCASINAAATNFGSPGHATVLDIVREGGRVRAESAGKMSSTV